MASTHKKWSFQVTAAALAGALAFASPVSGTAQAPSGPDAQIQADVTKALDKKQYQSVQVNVNDGLVRLTGTVATYADKQNADKATHHRKNVRAVDNEIQVAGAEVDDATLTRKLGEKLTYDRVGYGTTAFNSITLSVHNGVVTLGGTAFGPPDKDSAVSLVANYPGVKDVVDNISVDPLSPNDNRIRVAEFRTIYSFPTLNKYAIDPAKPIRITVVNGQVTLTGVVESEQDKEAAYIRANSVPGVFKVTNDLQVATSQISQK